MQLGASYTCHPAALKKPSLLLITQTFLRANIAETTRRTYLGAYQQFTWWLKANNVPQVIPPLQETLVLYVVDKSSSLKFASLRKHLAAVQYFSGEAGFEEILRTMKVLKRVLTGIKRTLGDTRLPKIPITPQLLLKFSRADVRYWAMACCALFGLLRIGELLDSSTKVQMFTDHMILRIEKSKTDPFRHGADVVIGSLPHSEICPLKAMHLWLQVRGPGGQSGRLFDYADSKVSRPGFVRWIKQNCTRLGLDSSQYSGHSFRRGGASVLANSGVSDVLIKTAGRWESEAYQLYCELDSTILKTLSRRMVDSENLGKGSFIGE